MQIQGWRLHIRLAEHHVNLAAMMRLMVKEMQDGHGCDVHAIFAPAICVAKGRQEKSRVCLFEEGFNFGILRQPRCVEVGKGVIENRVQWRCRTTSAGKS